MNDGLLLIAPGLADEDWEAAEFAKMVCEAVTKQRADVITVAPQGGLAISCSKEIFYCRSSALRLGLVTEQLTRLVRERGLVSALIIGDLAISIPQALRDEGIVTSHLRLADALAASDTPEPPRAPVISLTYEEARAMVAAPDGRRLEVAFPAIGTSSALDAIAALSMQNPEQRPLLVLADLWEDAAVLRQEAELSGLAQHVTFCGPVPLDLRGALVRAASRIHLPSAAGAYQGEAARLASSCDTGDDNLPELTDDVTQQWAEWALRPRSTVPASPAYLAAADERVAVFLPSRGCRQWLPEAIEGIIGQTHSAVHVFVCADGGGDIDAELLSMFPQATFFATAHAVGPYAIANALMAATVSNCIAFQDADDVSESRRISSQLTALHRLRLDGVGTNNRVINIGGELIGVESRPVAASAAIRDRCADLLLHPTSLFRRDALERLGGFDSATRFGADTDLHFRAAFTHRMGNVPELLYTRRERPQSLTRLPQTGFGSEARRQYSEPLHAAFRRMLETGEVPQKGRTLAGHPIAQPELGALQMINAGEGCSRWMSQRAAQIVAY